MTCLSKTGLIVLLHQSFQSVLSWAVGNSYERGLRKSLEGQFHPLYSRFDKDPKLDFALTLLEFMELDSQVLIGSPVYIYALEIMQTK